MEENFPENGTVEAAPDEELGSSLPAPEPFQLQENTVFDKVPPRSLSELLKFHDKVFVINTYAAVVGRDPEPEELARALHELRGGVRTKTAIIEDLAATHQVRVEGLSSPLVRRLRQAPLIGYLFRVIRAIGRLPVLMQHQQQFESFIIGQQERMADYINDVTRLRGTYAEVVRLNSEEAETLSDTVATVMMLSDSMIELSSSFAAAEQRLQNLETEQQNTALEFRSTLSALSEALQRGQERLTVSIQETQQHLAELQRIHDSTVAAQREFLINEQRAIVETERAAFNDLQDQIDRMSREKETRAAWLETELRQLRAIVDEHNQAAVRK